MILCLQLLKLNRKSDKQQDLSHYQVPRPSKRVTALVMIITKHKLYMFYQSLDFSDMLEVWSTDDDTSSLSPTFFRLQKKKRGKVCQNIMMGGGKGKKLFYSVSEPFLEDLGSSQTGREELNLKRYFCILYLQ